MTAASASLGRLVADAASADPAATAIVDVDVTLDYAALDRLVGATAAALTTLGVTPGDRVGVHLLKTHLGTVAMHAVVRSGAVAVPLDPSSPPARLARICEAMGISVIVSHGPRSRSVAGVHEIRPLAGVVGLEPGAVVDLPTISWDDVVDLTPSAPVPVDPDADAYVITTSGSTGEPKGIVHTHRSALAHVGQAIETFGFGPQDRVADIAPHHFDISTHSLWAVPRVGAAAVVVPEPHQRLPASHAQRLEETAISVWYSVPFLLRELLVRGDLVRRDLGSIRWVLFGGEPVDPSVIGDLMSFVPNARFANLYGPAEVNTCSVAVFDEPPPPDRTLSIGDPCPGHRFRLAPPGVARPEGPDAGQAGASAEGELWVAAPTMMRGYWGRSEADSAIAWDDDVRWYRTGDLVSHESGSGFTFHGRVDHQVKVRGHRVELEGVEVELERFEAVDEVVVAVLRTDEGLDELVAGVLGVDDDFAEDAFLSHARAALPAYAVPSQIVVLTSKIFTGSGKLDRRSLRAEARARLRPQTAGDATDGTEGL